MERPDYMEFLIQNRDKENVKILTGLRGSGKTTLLDHYRQHLIDSGVPARQIIYVDVSDPAAAAYRDGRTLFNALCRRLVPSVRNYIFLDEIQNTAGFEQTADDLFIRKNTDVYLTSSGNGAASAALLKLLPGRCAKKIVYPLSYAEYANGSTGKTDEKELFASYISQSTLPGYHRAQKESLENLCSSVLLKDILLHDRTLRPSLLNRILTYITAHAGRPLSRQRIAAAAGRVNRPLVVRTVHTYMAALASSGILQCLELRGTAGKKENGNEYVFYMTDPGMIPVIAGSRKLSADILINHAICMELLRRRESVSALRIAPGCIGFLTSSNGISAAWLVLPSASSKEGKEKAAAFRKTDWGCVKYILAPDIRDSAVSSENVQKKNLLKWLRMA